MKNWSINICCIKYHGSKYELQQCNPQKSFSNKTIVLLFLIYKLFHYFSNQASCKLKENLHCDTELLLYCISQQFLKCFLGKTLTNKCSSYILPIVISGVHTVVAACEDSLIEPVC